MGRLGGRKLQGREDEEDEDVGNEEEEDEDEDEDEEDEDDEEGGDDDEEEDEDEDDEEDDMDARPRKRRRGRKELTGVRGLIDEEADEDGDDEDDIEDDDDGAADFVEEDNEAVLAQARKEAALRNDLRRQRERDNDDVEDIIKERGWDEEDREWDNDDADEDPERMGSLEQQSFLPTNKDPKIFLVRCKERHEHRAVISLLQKHFEMEKRGMPLAITAVIAPVGLKGIIYVEAFAIEAVRIAIHGLHLIQQYKVDMVPLEEAPNVLHVPPKKNHIKKGAWVRVRRGPYRGDLAQVYNEHEGDNDGTVTVRLIPRINLMGARDNFDEQENDQDGKRKRRPRPPQKLFDKEEVQRTIGEVVVRSRDRGTGEEFFVFRNDSYRYGLLYKRIPVNGLLGGEGVSATLEELEKFQAAEERRKKDRDEDNEEEEMDLVLDPELDLSQLATNKKVTFFKGDSVKFVSSDLRGLLGTVSLVEGDKVMVKCEELDEPVAANRSDLVKSFTPGSHVRMTEGRNAGETGVVVEVSGDVLTIISDSSKEEVRVLATDVVDPDESSAMSASTLKTPFVLFDLVSLFSDPRLRGVVVKVQRDSVTLLVSTGQVLDVPLKDISKKINDGRASAHDRNNAAIFPGLTIRVMGGPLSQRQGIVKHITGDKVFFQARDEIKNCGMLVVSSTSCEVLGARKMDSHEASNGGSLRGPARARMKPTFAGSNTNFFGMKGPKPQGVGTVVTITKGVHKGYKGRVIDLNDVSLRVELSGTMKVVSVPIESVRGLQGVIGAARPSPYPSAGYSEGKVNDRSTNGGYGLDGSRTPRYDGSRTPHHDGSRTPHHDGSRTPRYDGPGSRTPVWTGVGSRTPRNDPSRTPNPYGESARTPLHDSWRPMTPARNSSSYDAFRESAWAPTPGPDSYSIPAATPYTPLTPGGPMPTDYRTPMTPFTPLPSTPMVEPSTPYGVPQTPMTPSGAGGPSDDEGVRPTAHMVGVEVIVESSGEIGVVRSITTDSGSLTVWVEKVGKTVTVVDNEWKLKEPMEGSRVRLLQGENAGMEGELIGVVQGDGEGVVKLDDTAEIIIPKLETLGKIA